MSGREPFDGFERPRVHAGEPAGVARERGLQVLGRLVHEPPRELFRRQSAPFCDLLIRATDSG